MAVISRLLLSKVLLLTFSLCLVCSVEKAALAADDADVMIANIGSGLGMGINFGFTLYDLVKFRRGEHVSTSYASAQLVVSTLVGAGSFIGAARSTLEHEDGARALLIITGVWATALIAHSIYSLATGPGEAKKPVQHKVAGGFHFTPLLAPQRDGVIGGLGGVF